MADIIAKLGKQAAAAGVDPAKAGAGRKPEPGEAEGQWVSMSGSIYVCPECWTMNDVVVDPIRVSFYRCWSCGAFLQI